MRHRLRIRFRKEGELRLISHRDLLRAMERLFRRAELPLGMSEGFRPKARMMFPSALAVGVAGTNEVLDLELSEEWPAEQVQAALTAAAPEGLSFTSVAVLPPENFKKAIVRRFVFEVPIPAERAAGVSAAVERFLAAAEFPIQREDKKKTLDLRPLVDALEMNDHVLRMGLVMTPAGSARPREVLAAVGAEDLEALGACITRTAVELNDETSEGAADEMAACAPEDTTSLDSTDSPGVPE
jgi:radical SAM-linked protein